MTRTGIVESVSEDGARIVLADASCDGCSTPCGGCSRKRKPQIITLKTELSVSVGDRVQLSCPSSSVVWYSVLLFLIPLCLAFGLCLFLIPRLGEGMAALFSALGALIAFFVGSAVVSLPVLKRKNAFVLERVLVPASEEK